MRPTLATFFCTDRSASCFYQAVAATFTGTATVLQNKPSFMETLVQPWKTFSATLGLGVLSKGWNLAELSDPATPRVFSVEVPFAEPFASPPVVHASLTGFDMDHAFSNRLSLKVSDITPTGFSVNLHTWNDTPRRARAAAPPCFSVNLHTWNDTRVYAVELSWLAIGA